MYGPSSSATGVPFVSSNSMIAAWCVGRSVLPGKSVTSLQPKTPEASGLRPVVVGEQVLGRTVEVVELAALDRAPERPADHEYEYERDRDEDVEAFHGGEASGRIALSTTMNELADMPSAASQGPIRPSAASGSATAL